MFLIPDVGTIDSTIDTFDILKPYTFLIQFHIWLEERLVQRGQKNVGIDNR